MKKSSSPTYTRVCSCGDVAIVTYKPKEGTKCRLCRGREQAKVMHAKNTKKEGTHIRYTYECPDCGSIRVSAIKHKTAYCGKCNRRRTGEANKGKVKEMRYFRICPTCPEDSNTRKVASKLNAGIKQCKACLNAAKRTATKANPKKYARKYTPIGVDGRQKVNLKKVKEVKPAKELTQEESLRMQEEFLKRRKLNG